MRSPQGSAQAALLPIALLIVAMVSIQAGAAIAKSLFPVVGAPGVTVLRVGFSAVILAAIWRPWRHRLGRREAGAIALYGAALGLMNLLFYLSLSRIPLGIAVAIEFVGPLGVALYGSRNARDLAWIGLAVFGLVLLLPLSGSEGIDPTGALLALGAGLFWALYIVFGQRAGLALGGQAVPLGMTAATCVVAPFGIIGAGAALLEPATLFLGLAIAILSSALPYTLEMAALQRLPREVFGVLMSLEPAIAALTAATLLGEYLSFVQSVAILCVIAASAGVTLGAGQSRVDTSHR